MSNLSFKDPQATPVQSADANGSQSQEQGQQAQHQDNDARLKELEAKFNTVQKRVDDSQEYIKALKAQLEEKEAQLAKARKIDDVYSALKEEPQQHQPHKESPAPIDAEELLSKAEERVMLKLQAQRQAQDEEANFKYVASELTKKFGDLVDDKVKELASEAGLSVEEVAQMARQKPKALLRMFVVETKTTTSSAKPTSGSFNTQAAKAHAPKAPSKPPRLGDFNAMKTWMEAQARILATKE